MLKRPKRNYLSIFLFSQDYYEQQSERLELMVKSTTASNHIMLEKFKISIKTKRV